VREREKESVCVSERERERERESVCECERERKSVCECERERERVCVCGSDVEVLGDQVHTEAFCGWPKPFASSIASVYTLTVLLIRGSCPCHYTLISPIPKTSRATNEVKAPLLFIRKLSFSVGFVQPCVLYLDLKESG
jgi:hypothetical protein